MMYDYSYIKALELKRNDTDFYALIMAAMMKADTPNFQKLIMAYPDVYEELQLLYNGKKR